VRDASVHVVPLEQMPSHEYSRNDVQRGN